MCSECSEVTGTCATQASDVAQLQSRWVFIMKLENQKKMKFCFWYTVCSYMKGPNLIKTSDWYTLNLYLTRLWLHYCIVKTHTMWFLVHLFPLSPCRKINRSRPLCCLCQTTSRQDMAASNPLEICPSKKEYRGGPLEIVCILSLIPFFQKAERKKELLT